jgi:hypothetical protein
MGAANLRHSDIAPQEPADHLPLYKHDRPRRIDLTISFFGDDQNDDACGEQLLESLSSEWADR